MALTPIAMLIFTILIPIVIVAITTGVLDSVGFKRPMSLYLMSLPWIILLWLGLMIVSMIHLSSSGGLVIVCFVVGFSGGVFVASLNLRRWHLAHQISGWLSMLVLSLPMAVVAAVFLHAMGSPMTGLGPQIVVLVFVILCMMALCSLLSFSARRRHYDALALQGSCIACQYDLRGNPEAEHCPECGHEVVRTNHLSIKNA
jgi:hypothetical protein